jgi:hypothetical protein
VFLQSTKISQKNIRNVFPRNHTRAIPVDSLFSKGKTELVGYRIPLLVKGFFVVFVFDKQFFQKIKSKVKATASFSRIYIQLILSTLLRRV